MQQQRARVWILCIAVAACACSEDRLIGERCPNPYWEDGDATLAPDAGAAEVYGTSCAPCEDNRIRLDRRGCPIYVSFQSCGGDICIGNVRVRAGAGEDEDAGTGEDEDGGTDDDGGAGEEDGGGG